jgi:hypothetical protein
MACFTYPKEEFKEKPDFVAASFFVSEVESAKTENVCLKGSRDWFVINSKAGTTTINHITFKIFEIGRQLGRWRPIGARISNFS